MSSRSVSKDLIRSRVISPTNSQTHGVDTSESRRVDYDYSSELTELFDAHAKSEQKKEYRNIVLAALSVMGVKGIPFLLNFFKSKPNVTNEDFLKSLYGSAYTPSSGSGFLSGLGNIFKGFSSRIGDIGSGLLGIGSELGSSILNYQNQVKLIDKQNEYNTPANQMQRFKEAGLNPNLIYGLGSNGNQPASGSIAPVDFDTAQRENRMARMQIATQTKLAEAEIADKMADVDLKQKQGANVSAQTAYQQLVNNNYLTKLQVDIDNINASTDKLRQEKQILEHDTHTAEVRTRITEIEEQIAKNEKEISDKKKEYAEATAFTEMLGNVFGINFGFGFNMSRGRTTTFRGN